MSFHFSFLKKSAGLIPTTGGRAVEQPLQQSEGCLVCPLNAIEGELTTPKMQPVGPEDAALYVLGEAPGRDEDEQGQAFVGKAGRLLRDHFPNLREWDASRRWNTIRCRPPNNRDPAPSEMNACRGFIREDIERVKPRVILGTGVAPLKWMLTGGGKISSWRGRKIPVRIGTHTAWFCPVMHPSYVARTGDSKSPHSQVLRRDIQRAVALANSRQEPAYVSAEGALGGVEVYDGSDLSQLGRLEQHLRRLARHAYVGFDYETWPLRPYRSDSQLISVAMGTGTDVAAFAIEHKDVVEGWAEKALDLLCWFVLNSGRKICHNLVFEMEWTAAKLHPYVLRRTGWEDTQAQAYSLNEQDRRMLSLDNVVLENFGFNLKQISSLDRRDMRKHALRDVLEYNGLDSKWTYNAFFAQQKRMDKADDHEYQRLVRTCPTVALTQRKGVTPNAPEVRRQHAEMVTAIKDLDAKLREFPEVSSFQMKKGETFNPDSSAHIGEILYKEFGEAEVLSASGGYSTGADVLQAVGNEFASTVLKYRSVANNVQFVSQLDPAEKKTVVHGDGIVHTNYNLVFASTGRTTSSDPNLQNYPSRVLRSIRNCIRARLGHKFVACDYGSFEARVIAMASRDRNLVKYIWDGYDVHGYWARRLVEAGGDRWKKMWWRKFGQPETFDKFIKMLRGHIKNSWTFPLFYGATFRKCAALLLLDENVTKSLVNEFWKDFSRVREWQDELNSFYREHGYVQTLNGGRKRREPLTYNELINSPIQGSASDIVVDAWNRLSEYDDLRQFARPEFQACKNIHDDLTFEIPEDRVEESVKTIVHHMLDCPFEWTRVVPLEVEVSVGDLWGDLKPYGTWDNSEWAERYSHSK